MIVFCADHGGIFLKNHLLDYIKSKNIETYDCGAFTFDNNDDYPDYALPATKIVAKNKLNRGIFICGSGIGMAMASNRNKKIRATTAYNIEQISLARKDEDANVLCLGARLTDLETAKKIVDSFLTTSFEGGRHLRRINKY